MLCRYLKDVTSRQENYKNFDVDDLPGTSSPADSQLSRDVALALTSFLCGLRYGSPASGESSRDSREAVHASVACKHSVSRKNNTVAEHFRVNEHSISLLACVRVAWRSYRRRDRTSDRRARVSLRKHQPTCLKFNYLVSMCIFSYRCKPHPTGGRVFC